MSILLFHPFNMYLITEIARLKAFILIKTFFPRCEHMVCKYKYFIIYHMCINLYTYKLIYHICINTYIKYVPMVCKYKYFIIVYRKLIKRKKNYVFLKSFLLPGFWKREIGILNQQAEVVEGKKMQGSDILALGAPQQTYIAYLQIYL